MKKLSYFFKVTLLVLFFSGFANGQMDYTGDLSFINNSNNETITVTVECTSIPFEGSNQNLNTNSYNRVDTLQNGSIYRRFTWENGKTDYNIYYHKFDITPNETGVNIAHCSANPTSGQRVWGYGKYKITIFDGTNSYIAYLNNLDSRYSAPVNGLNYANDFVFEYYGVNQDVIFKGNGDSLYTDTIPVYDPADPIQEFKVWKIIQNSDVPLERRFYARTTPFGLRPSDLDLHGRSEFIIGTTVILDTVWKEEGNQDRWGFNTQNDPYYINPFWVPNNDPGNTFISPGHYYYVNNELIAGLKFNMEYNDSLILKNDKRLFIIGNVFSVNGDGGDTLLLKQGSCVVLENNAELNTFYGGTLTSRGGEIVMSKDAIVEAYGGNAPTEINIYGEYPTIIKGGKVKIQELATLRIGDNSTLIFDGEGAHLEIHPDANLILGENSKIEFRNGAYLDADGITFSGDSGAIWGGLVFHNAGGQTQIKNCTFNDAKISIDIKNTTGCYADLEKRITGNTFNQPSIGSHSIRAENVFKLLLQGNTFNIAANKTGVEILNRINAGNSQEDGGN
ncbi:MAG: hypothetical protein H3C44_04015 [Ignavibacteria bacterium]|nr:hypothetical protein [Ignavibacteria bacterium]